LDRGTKFRFKKFPVYQDSKKYCCSCREIIDKQIKRRNTGLASQIDRALTSIVLNIAEGSADHSDNEFARFLSISVRSVYETVAAFDLALLYGIISEEMNEKIESEAHSLVRQLCAFRNSLKKRSDL
jgi:four helix bundle protein